MASDKKDAPTALPPSELPEGAQNPEPEEKIIPAKGDDGHETPSGYALAKVGADGDGSRYLQEKSKKRWGVG